MWSNYSSGQLISVEHHPGGHEQVMAMSRVGKIGLLILWVTGLTMVFTRWQGFATLPPTFHVKLTAVVLLTITVGYIHRRPRRIL